MKNTVTRMMSLLLVVCMAAAVFAACGNTEDPTPNEPAHIDYAVAEKLDMSSPTKKQEVTFGPRSQIDGDTSHFEVPNSVNSAGVIKARYLAVDTPESTGQIEEWGKAASLFTNEKMSSDYKIIVETDTAD